MNGIASNHLETVKVILLRHVPDREVWIFGSRATGTAKQFSDLDLAVIGTTPLTLSVRASLDNDFDESELPFKVDVVDWATTNDSFREIIRKTAIPLPLV